MSLTSICCAAMQKVPLQYLYGLSLTHFCCHGNVFNSIRVIFRSKSWTNYVERDTILRYSYMCQCRFVCGEILWNLLYVFIINFSVFLLYITQTETRSLPVYEYNYKYTYIHSLFYICQHCFLRADIFPKLHAQCCSHVA